MENKNTKFKSSLNGVKVHPNAFVDPSAELNDGSKDYDSDYIRSHVDKLTS